MSCVAVDGGNSGTIRIPNGGAGNANANKGVRNGKILAVAVTP